MMAAQQCERTQRHRTLPFNKVKTVTSVGFVFSTINNFLMVIDPQKVLEPLDHMAMSRTQRWSHAGLSNPDTPASSAAAFIRYLHKKTKAQRG